MFSKTFWASSFTTDTTLTSKFPFSFLKVDYFSSGGQWALNSDHSAAAHLEWFSICNEGCLWTFLSQKSPRFKFPLENQWRFSLQEEIKLFFSWISDSMIWMQSLDIVLVAKPWNCHSLSVWCCWKEMFGWRSSCWSDGSLQGSHVTCTVTLVTSQFFGAVSNLLSWICCHKGQMVKMPSVPGKRFNLNPLHLQINSFSCCNDRCNKLSLP